MYVPRVALEGQNSVGVEVLPSRSDLGLQQICMRQLCTVIVIVAKSDATANYTLVLADTIYGELYVSHNPKDFKMPSYNKHVNND